MAAIIPSTAFLPRTIHLGLTAMDRRAIEAQIESLIELLDQFDGDPDLEPEHEDYDACDAGEPANFVEMLPVYGLDQSKGPLNEREAIEDHQRRFYGEPN
ncbi:hypothetical protein [uncultured Novosphingobium sp.]|uniref:hypothetical protein n=1 Tax=uncultured Novosphingobium sp. TaxID=292277 RepID=UPI00259A8DCC|nr:hypothetical protein [uncultured Novosphingobium sp.]